MFVRAYFCEYSACLQLSAGGFSLTPLTGTGDTAAAATPTTRLLGDLSLVTPKSVPTATSSASTTGTKRKRGTETDAAGPTPKISALTSASGPLRARFEDTEATSISDTISLSPAQIDRMILHFERRAHQAALMAGLSVDAAVRYFSIVCSLT
jgi:hypothetical protein